MPGLGTVDMIPVGVGLTSKDRQNQKLRKSPEDSKSQQISIYFYTTYTLLQSKIRLPIFMRQLQWPSGSGYGARCLVWNVIIQIRMPLDFSVLARRLLPGDNHVLRFNQSLLIPARVCAKSCMVQFLARLRLTERHQSVRWLLHVTTGSQLRHSAWMQIRLASFWINTGHLVSVSFSLVIQYWNKKRCRVFDQLMSLIGEYERIGPR